MHVCVCMLLMVYGIMSISNAIKRMFICFPCSCTSVVAVCLPYFKCSVLALAHLLLVHVWHPSSYISSSHHEKCVRVCVCQFVSMCVLRM